MWLRDADSGSRSKLRRATLIASSERPRDGEIERIVGMVQHRLAVERERRVEMFLVAARQSQS